MSVESRVLAEFIKHEWLDHQPEPVNSAAVKAVAEGYESLSESEKLTLAPILTRKCYGVEHSAVGHIKCGVALSMDELHDAIPNDSYYGALLCRNCTDKISTLFASKNTDMPQSSFDDATLDK